MNRRRGVATVVCFMVGTLDLNGQAVNSASSASSVAAGSLVSVYGKFTNSTGQAVSLPLPTSAGQFYFLLWDGHSAVSDTVANRVPLLYWGPFQVNLVLPNTVTTGSVLVARNSGLPDGSAPLNVSLQAPGIFINSVADCSILGCGQKLQRGILTDASGNLILSENPVHPKQSFVIWGTGLGVTPTAPQVLLLPATGEPIAATVFYSGHTTFAGLDQVNVTLPNGNTLVSGCMIGAHVELQLAMKSTISGVQSNTVSLPLVMDSCD